MGLNVMASTLPTRVAAQWVCPALLALDVLAGVQAAAGQRADGPAAVRREDGKPIPAAASPASPIQVYRASCLECHDSDGRGEIARDLFPKVPDFTNPTWQGSRTDEQLGRSILEGKGKSMPRMREKLGTVDVRKMVVFVRGFRGGKQVVDDEPAAPDEPDQAPPAADSAAFSPRPTDPAPSPRRDSIRGEGARLFQRLCAKCHATDGRGTAARQNLPTIPDFALPSWQAARSNPQLMVSVLEGKGTGMPAFRDKVSRDQARDLVAFVRAFDPTREQSEGTTPDPFEARFRELEREIEALREKFRALSSPIPSPRRPATPAPPSPR
jgi:mono/diheme cytochrome c family protein